MKRRKQRKINWKNIIATFFIITCLICLIVSVTKIINWILDSKKTNDQININTEKIEIKDIEDNENTEIIEQKEIEKTNPYWDYIKMKLIDVDFQELKKINSSTVGWLQVNGTNINYPFVQTKDNKYYLTHSFDKTYNDAGWVFLDHRNDSVGIDKNTIIYAHGRNDKTMFGSLKNILTSNWLKNKNNYVLKISTEKENSLWQVFSIYNIPTTSDYLQINFNNDNEFLEFGNMLLERSEYNFNTSINSNDLIITLSTCYNNKNKVVLHAKLIKYTTN